MSERGIPESGHAMYKGPEGAFKDLQAMPCPGTAEQENWEKQLPNLPAP